MGLGGTVGKNFFSRGPSRAPPVTLPHPFWAFPWGPGPVDLGSCGGSRQESREFPGSFPETPGHFRRESHEFPGAFPPSSPQEIPGAVGEKSLGAR